MTSVHTRKTSLSINKRGTLCVVVTVTPGNATHSGATIPASPDSIPRGLHPCQCHLLTKVAQAGHAGANAWCTRRGVFTQAGTSQSRYEGRQMFHALPQQRDKRSAGEEFVEILMQKLNPLDSGSASLLCEI